MRFLIYIAFALLAVPASHAQDYEDPIERALAEYEWESTVGDGVRTYYKAGSFAERHRHMLVRSAEVALDEALHYMGQDEYASELRLIYVESRSEMEELVGRPVTGLAVWTGHGVFLVVNPEWRSFEKHEIAHVLTMGEWGRPHASSQWMVEGISIACDGWCRTNTVDEIARHLLSQGELPPLARMLRDVGALGEVRGGMYAASVIDYIRTTYGIDAVRRLWTEGTVGLREIVGGELNELESDWKAHLEGTVDPGVEIDYDAIEERGCG
jgi:hypothetical protein